MNYGGMPVGMWLLFGRSFQRQLETVLGYGGTDAVALSKRAGSLAYRFGALEVATRESDLLWELRDYLETHPRAALVNLGCGLDQTAENADNGLCRIVNIDLPDGMAHGELALVYPERLYAEVVRFLAGAGAKCNKEQADERDRPARRLGQTFMI